MPQVKNLVFTFITVVVVPLVFFLLIELGFTVAGVGKNYDYFHEIDIDGVRHYQENPDFADQFYPPSLNVGPLENTFAIEPSNDRVRVLVLGGSAAMGFPHKNHGIDRLLAAQLQSMLPGKEIEVINTAMTAVNSHVVYEVARTLPDGIADYAVILMGNNEVVGPYGPGTLSQNFLSNLSFIRSLQSLKRTRLWQGLEGLINNASADDAMADLEWRGMQMFVDNGVTRDDPRMSDVYRHYESNLRDTIDLLSDKGMKVVLSTVPVNLSDSAPFLSLHNPGVTTEEKQRFETLMTAARELQANGQWTAAAEQFRAAIEIDSDYADAHFGLAQALEGVGDFKSARLHYEQAIDLDALRFRADTRINQIIREVAEELSPSGLIFVDSESLFSRASAPRAPGWNVLLEHVHYDFSGNRLLSEGFAQAVVSAEGRSFRPLPVDELAARIGYPNHETIENLKGLKEMAKQPPFPGQSNYDGFIDFLDDQIAAVTAEVGSPSDVFQRRQAVVAAGTGDWRFYFEMAALAKFLRRQDQMEFYLTQLLERYPHNRETFMNMAEFLGREGRWAEVVPVLERALHYTRGQESRITETKGFLGTALLRAGQLDEAEELLLSLPEDYPHLIGTSFRAYGNLIRQARDDGKPDKVAEYVYELKAYAADRIDEGADEDYSRFNQRMSQLLTIAGYEAEAALWAKGLPAL